MQYVPLDIWMHIYSFVPTLTLYRQRRTCKLWDKTLRSAWCSQLMKQRVPSETKLIQTWQAPKYAHHMRSFKENVMLFSQVMDDDWFSFKFCNLRSGEEIQIYNKWKNRYKSQNCTWATLAESNGTHLVVIVYSATQRQGFVYVHDVETLKLVNQFRTDSTGVFCIDKNYIYIVANYVLVTYSFSGQILKKWMFNSRVRCHSLQSFNNKIFVNDREHGKVWIFDGNGTCLKEIEVDASPFQVWGMAVAHKYIFITYSKQGWIRVFNQEGQFLWTYHFPPAENFDVGDICYQDGRLVVHDWFGSVFVLKLI